MSEKDTKRSSRDGSPQVAAVPNKTSKPKQLSDVTTGGTKVGTVKRVAEQHELMRFKECASDGSVSVKTIERWVGKGYLSEWRPHPKSRTRRIKRPVWEAFKHRQRGT